jgi:hypothetical protein
VYVTYVGSAVIESVLEGCIVHDDDEYKNDENKCFEEKDLVVIALQPLPTWVFRAAEG